MPEPGDRLDLALREAGQVLSKGKRGGSIVVLADSVKTDPAELQVLEKDLAYPVQFLAINAPDSTQNDSVRAAAHTLKATIEFISVEDDDIRAIVSSAANTPVAQLGEQGGQWHEAGYWVVPFVGVALLGLIHRQHMQKVSA